jgi:tetratricopeptide (TPR) repeat protein
VAAEGLDRSRALNNLGVALREQGKVEAAVRVHREALAIRERTFGRQHFTVAQSLFNLAGAELDRGKTTTAVALVERSLAIREATYGHDHPTVAEALALRAEIARAEGRVDAAETDWRAAIGIRESALGALHPEAAATRLHLAAFLASLDRRADARPLAEAALAALTEAEGAHPLDVLRARALVAELRLLGGDAGGAAAATAVGSAAAGDARAAIEAFAARLVSAGLVEEAARLRAAVRASEQG